MPVNCKLCGELLEGSTGTRCRCGWRLDGPCHDGHDAWCPADGDDRWVGAQEF